MKRLTKFIALLTAAVMAMTSLLIPAGAASELLVNGNASNGLKGWKDPDGIWQTGTNYDGVSAYDSYYFYPRGYKGSAGTRIYQDVNIGSYAGMKATLSAQNRTYNSGHTDESMLKIEFFDSNGKLIDSASSKKDSKNASWHLLSVSATVPKNASVARVSLYSFYHTGSESDSYFDNVSLTVSGTPAAEDKLAYFQITLKKGSTLQLDGILDSGSGAAASFSSSKSSVASVSSKGKVTAKAKGTAVITAKYGSSSIKIRIKVTA